MYIHNYRKILALIIRMACNSLMAALEFSFIALMIYENSRVRTFVAARVEVLKYLNIFSRYPPSIDALYTAHCPSVYTDALNSILIMKTS